jgi:hypothetical protein
VRDEAYGAAAAELCAEWFGCDDDQCAQLVDRCGTRGDGPMMTTTDRLYTLLPFRGGPARLGERGQT